MQFDVAASDSDMAANQKVAVERKLIVAAKE